MSCVLEMVLLVWGALEFLRPVVELKLLFLCFAEEDFHSIWNTVFCPEINQRRLLLVIVLNVQHIHQLDPIIPLQPTEVSAETTVHHLDHLGVLEHLQLLSQPPIDEVSQKFTFNLCGYLYQAYFALIGIVRTLYINPNNRNVNFAKIRYMISKIFDTRTFKFKIFWAEFRNRLKKYVVLNFLFFHCFFNIQLQLCFYRL